MKINYILIILFIISVFITESYCVASDIMGDPLPDEMTEDIPPRDVTGDPLPPPQPKKSPAIEELDAPQKKRPFIIYKNPTVYFYNAESNINNFVTVKRGFDLYFSTNGGYFIQPFDIRENFEGVINEKKGDVYLLSNWHLKELQKKQVPLQLAMVATSKGKIKQKKVLVTNDKITDIAMLKNKVVAIAGSKSYAHTLLKQILGKKHEALLKDISILLVPKDIDALLTIGFRMANAAVSAETGLERLELINYNNFKELHTLAFSKEDYFLVAATLKHPGKKEALLLKELRKMPESSYGLDTLQLIKIDGWKVVK